jgi:hypothetical protein
MPRYTISERTSAFIILDQGQERGLAIYLSNHAAREAMAKGRSISESTEIENEERERCRLLAVETVDALNRV